MDNTIINFRTKDWVKREFMRLCKDDNTNATSVLNQFMRNCLKDAGVTAPTQGKVKHKETVSHEWRDELVTRTF